MKQAEELVDSYLKKSTADAVILGGDFNAPPILKPGILHYILLTSWWFSVGIPTENHPYLYNITLH